MRHMTVILLMGMWLGVVVFCPGKIPAEEVFASPFEGHVTRVGRDNVVERIKKMSSPEY